MLFFPIFALLYLLFLAAAVCIGGFLLGYFFRRGWDMAGRR